MPKADLYESCEIEISRCTCEECERWEVRILASPFDRPRARFNPPYDAQSFLEDIEGLEPLLLSRKDADVLQAQALARKIGGKLRDAILSGAVGDTFRRCVREAAERGSRAGLRVRFSFGSPRDFEPEIVGLPWELLLDPDNETFLSRGARNQVVRYVDLPIRGTVLRIPRPLRVLVVMASPKVDWLPSLDPLIAEHKKGLRECLGRQGDVRMRFLKRPTLPEMQKELARRDYHVLHFLGHGDLEEDSGRGYLFFEDEAGGCREVSGEMLAEILERPGANPLRVAVINACQGAKTPRMKHHRYWAGVGNALVAQGFPAVVAMQFAISGKAAVAFGEGFYTALAAGKAVDVAVAEGRQQIMTDSEVPDTLEWATPVLTLRTRDARIFEVEDSLPQPVRLGVLSIDEFGCEAIQDQADHCLDLREYFPEGSLYDPPGSTDFWNRRIGPRLREFLRKEISDQYPNRLDFSAQQTLAFACGYFLPSRAGIELWVGQRGRSGSEVWKETDSFPEGAPTWQRRGRVSLDEGSSDLAVTVSMTWPTDRDVRRYLDPRNAGEPERSQAPIVSTLWIAELEGEPGRRRVQGGGHARYLAEHLARDLNRYLAEHPAQTVHLFGAAPTAFWVFLGRECRLLTGKVQFYEYLRQGRTYTPSLALPLVSATTGC
jgi:hypothetical protein